MTPVWETVLIRAAAILEQLLQLWLAFKAGQWREQKKSAQDAVEIKDEQNKIAADRPVDRDDLVRRLRERGF